MANMFCMLDKWEIEKVSQIMRKVETEVEEIFSGIGGQSWMGDAGRESARRFLVIKNILDANDWDNNRKAEIISVFFGEGSEV